MPPLIKGRVVVADEWTYPEADNAADAPRRVLPLADYLAAAAAGQVGPSVGLLLLPADHDLAPLQPFVAALPIVVVHFGSSGEGRGYTQARLLRERYGYAGELRARGGVRADQMWFLARCGFDAFDLAPGEDPATVIAQLERFSVAYQQAPDLALPVRPRMRYGRPA